MLKVLLLTNNAMVVKSRIEKPRKTETPLNCNNHRDHSIHIEIERAREI
jgi:hypothetical protein